MPRILLSTLAVTAVLICSACDRSPPPNMLEPVYGVGEEPTNLCPDILGLALNDGFTSKYEIVIALYDGIDDLFQDIRSRNGAKSHVDNVVREVCAEDYVGAQEFVRNFIQQVENQPDGFLSPDKPHVEDLENWIRVLARPMANNVLPEGALGYTGALEITQGGTFADPVKTRNKHIIVNASDFPAGDPFVIAIAPGAGNFGPYVVYNGESYAITTDYPKQSELLTGAGVLIVFCGSPPAYLKIAHDKGTAGVEVLTTTGVDCTQYTSVSSLQGAPAWLRSLARLTGSAARKVFGPSPVYARAETGLGGRTKSFSPFALVTPMAILDVTCESRMAATLNVAVGDSTCVDTPDGGATVKRVELPVGSVTVTSRASNFASKRDTRYDIWHASSDLVLGPVACPPKWSNTMATCTFMLPATGGTLNVKLTGY